MRKGRAPTDSGAQEQVHRGLAESILKWDHQVTHGEKESTTVSETSHRSPAYKGACY